MKSLFNLENPLFQLLTRVGDLIILNVLFLLCSVPIVTAGAAMAAMSQVTQGFVMDKEPGVFKTFFKGFRENFKQATLIWLALLVIFTAMAANLFFITIYVGGLPGALLKGLVWLLLLLSLSVGIIMLQLIVRYKNDLRQHCTNAMILAVIKLPRTAAMLFLSILPFLIAYLSLNTFVNTLVFWLMIGFGFVNYLDSCLMAPVFRELEKEKEDT